MKPQSTRRHFLGASAAAAGGILLPRLGAAPPETLSNAHFLYRMPPAEGPYIDSQRDNLAFGFKGTKIYLSEDNGNSWAQTTDFPDAENITLSIFLKNGNILFATRNQLFLSTDKLKTFQPITVKRPDGSDYIPHTPKNPDLPGWYFHSLDGEHVWDIDGKELLVWGNYCNVVGGPVPVNIYYSTDQGQTVKLAYSFGQNPTFQEKVSETKLGNPDNSVIARHIHSVAYNPVERAFYACTGDIDRGHGNECHWLRGTYDAAADKWDWKVAISVNSNSRFKSGGINFVDGKLYWIADANGPKKLTEQKHDRGVFTCDPAQVADLAAHTMLYNPEYESANMLIQDGVMIASHCAPASPYACGFIYSPDMGKTWAQYDLGEEKFGRRSPVRFHKKNAEGWFRVDLRKGWIDRAEVLYIKPK